MSYTHDDLVNTDKRTRNIMLCAMGEGASVSVIPPVSFPNNYEPWIPPTSKESLFNTHMVSAVVKSVPVYPLPQKKNMGNVVKFERVRGMGGMRIDSMSHSVWEEIEPDPIPTKKVRDFLRKKNRTKSKSQAKSRAKNRKQS